MRNQRGEGYVLPCVLILAMSMVTSVLLMFATSISMVRCTKEQVTQTLDSYVMHHAVEIYNSLKQGSNNIQNLDGDEYRTLLCQWAGLDQRGELLYAHNNDGGLNYYMTTPQMQGDIRTLELQVSYTQYVPIRFFGKVVLYAQVPVTVTSALTSKF